MPSNTFKDFTREWGSLLALDTAASLDHFFSSYRRADVSDGRAATIEDYTDLWTAAKRANMEWEATCMVRSVCQSVALDGPVTSFHLMTSMTCWAATLHRRTADFFKECKTQVRDVVANVIARCTAWSGEDGVSELYHEIAFCVALELFGWHDSLLTCLRAVAEQQAGPADEQDVLLFIATVAQYLTPKYLPRGFSTESTPNLTTGRTSALSSSSEQDGIASHSHHTRDDAAIASAAVVVVDCPPPPPLPRATTEDAATQHVKFERVHAVGTARGVTAEAPPTAAAAAASPSTAAVPPASPSDGRAAVPPHPPRSRVTPQPSPVNDATTPMPPRRRDSATTTASAQDRKHRDEVRERRWPIAPKQRKAASKKDSQGCEAF